MIFTFLFHCEMSKSAVKPHDSKGIISQTDRFYDGNVQGVLRTYKRETWTRNIAQW
jgi:hypothetical protein